MKLEEITQGYRHEYLKVCSCCGLEQKILTQDNHLPEYETEIYLVCVCGEFIEFVLPVN